MPKSLSANLRTEHPAELAAELRAARLPAPPEAQPEAQPENRLAATSEAADETSAEPPLAYARSAPTAIAAEYAQSASSPADENHSLSLALELSHTLTSEQIESLRSNGPWLTSEGLSINAQQLIRAVQNATVHGLDPDSYEMAGILRTVDTLSDLDKFSYLPPGQLETVRLPDSLLLREDLSNRMDRAFLLLARHLGQGVVDARATQTRLYRDVPKVNTQHLLDSVRQGFQSALQALESVVPSHPEYQRLTVRMRNLLTERASGIRRTRIAPHVNTSGKLTLKNVLAIKSRLVDTGDLSPNHLVSPFFDRHLFSALKSFQSRHGIEASGSLDLPTRRVLNLSIDEEIQAVALSLERWRWMPRDLGKKHIFINIPDFHVEFRDGDETRLTMTAVVGAVEYPTPSFSRNMSYMEFNPTWTVPESIANRDLIPREREQPGYLVSRQFEYLRREDKGLVVVPPEQITVTDLQTEPFPYLLRQQGGPNNTLGRMKFMMPNPYAIYLHDTQSKNHFTLDDRAYSNGCIRLREPEVLARLLMQEDGYSQSTIDTTLQDTETRRVRLRTPIPTHLTYLTTWIDEHGELQRRADIYGQDETLTRALVAAGTLLTVLRNSDRANLELADLRNKGS